VRSFTLDRRGALRAASVVAAVARGEKGLLRNIVERGFRDRDQRAHPVGIVPIGTAMLAAVERVVAEGLGEPDHLHRVAGFVVEENFGEVGAILADGLPLRFYVDQLLACESQRIFAIVSDMNPKASVMVIAGQNAGYSSQPGRRARLLPRECFPRCGAAPSGSRRADP